MSSNITYHFYEIKINEPAFSDFYFKLFKKVDYPEFREFVMKGIKNQLRDLVLSGKEVGVMIEPEVDIYKPLKQNGYPYSDVIYMLRELGSEGEKYLENYSNNGSLKLTPKGKKWVMDLSNINQTTIPLNNLNYFDIPEDASKKLKCLLIEINDLTEIKPYANLIGHQLRTILTLILKRICENILEVETPSDSAGLRQLLSFSIEQCAGREKRLKEELIELKNSKYKDIIDDVIHDDHTTVNHLIIEKMMTHIKHILSLAFR